MPASASGSSLIDSIKKAANEAGFSSVGIADLDFPEKSGELFEQWLQKGMHADMRYLERSRKSRADPGKLLPGARSSVCLALNYWVDEGFNSNEQGSRDTGKFARYSRRGDYHVIMYEMLSEMDRRLRKILPGMNSSLCVDIKPVAERALAVKAGIGWIGKNTCIISPRHGSWIFLGEIITDAELPSSAPLKKECGSCTRCLDACPTGALDIPYLLDSRKCISYLTIENRKEIPEYLADRMGTHVFGCDICQEVCPYNDMVEISPVFSVLRESALIKFPLENLANISNKVFTDNTRGSVIARCKAEGMRRNASVALQNSKSR